VIDMRETELPQAAKDGRLAAARNHNDVIDVINLC
jgi:hypothetical protein